MALFAANIAHSRFRKGTLGLLSMTRDLTERFLRFHVDHELVFNKGLTPQEIPLSTTDVL